MYRPEDMPDIDWAILENGQYTEGGIKNCKDLPFLAQSVFDVVHRTADIITLFISFAEMNGKCDLSEFRAHSKDCGDPHPEQRTRTAGRDCRSNADDITGSNRRA